MGNLIAVLSLYYLCDQAAAARSLASHEVNTCMANYERLKIAFVEQRPIAPMGTPERAAQTRLGYTAFKAWEAKHQFLVAALRSEARERLGLS